MSSRSIWRRNAANAPWRWARAPRSIRPRSISTKSSASCTAPKCACTSRPSAPMPISMPPARPRSCPRWSAWRNTIARMVITAAYHQPLELPAGTMLTSEMTITTAVGYPTEMPEVIAAMPRLKDKIASMISHRVPFDEVIEGLKIAAHAANRPRSWSIWRRPGHERQKSRRRSPIWSAPAMRRPRRWRSRRSSSWRTISPTPIW